MAGQLVSTFKYTVLAAVAFIGPQLITNSGSYLGNVERKAEAPTQEPGLLTPDLLIPEPVSGGNQRSSAKLPKTGIVPATFLAPSVSQRPGREKWGSSLESLESLESVESSGTTWSAGYSPDNTVLEEYYPSSPVTPLEEVLRFDRQPDWILATWPRVDSVRLYYPLQGYRVSLITGREYNDLAGVLTWYFDGGQIQRITFAGRSGDYRKTLEFFERRFGMVLSNAARPGNPIYESTLHYDRKRKKSKEEISRLSIVPGQTWMSENRNSYYGIEFELIRPE